MRIYRVAFSILLGFIVLDSTAMADCAGLKKTKIADTEINKVEIVSSGTFTAADGYGKVTTYSGLPSFCRVIGTIRPTADSEIGFELWLPDGWNNRYLQ